MNQDTSTTTACDCVTADSAGTLRTRFFQRQLIGPDDLTQDQIYFREKLRRHNRLLHGWGVVAGARCRRGGGPCDVVIEPGYLLGPYGDEIILDQEVTVNVCQQDLDGNAAGPCGQPSDPWCSSVRLDRPAGQIVYLAVRYAECSDRPVQVATNGCGCDLSSCEYSRIRDSYVLKALAQLPASYPQVMRPPDLLQAFECPRPMHDCPTDPWVILADITMGSGQVAAIDCFAHRRYVVSFAGTFLMCQQEAYGYGRARYGQGGGEEVGIGGELI